MGKKKVPEVEETQKALVVADVIQPRRIRFLMEAFCSPYKKRAVELNKQLTNVEIKISECVFAAFGEYMMVVFKTNDGTTLWRCLMESMHPELWVHVSVISAWANVLNYEGSLRSKNCEIRRLFCSALMLGI